MGLPVDLEAIALRLGITLIPYPFPHKICGLAYVGKRKFILYNSNHPLPRQRFTIAHEIWHIERHLSQAKDSSRRSLKLLEMEANEGAAEILLPLKELKAHISEPRWRYNLTSLAKKALVSPITLVRRLNDTELLEVSLYSLKLNGDSLSVRRLIGKASPLPAYPALLEGARGREFFLKRDGLFFHFSRYGENKLLYIYL